MARTSIEESVHAKLHKISSRYTIKKRDVLGMLVDLWHNSQDALVVDATRDELVDFMEAWEEEDSFVDKVIEGYKWQRLVTVNDDGTFHICGNQDNIAGIEAKRRNGKKGGRRSADSSKKPVFSSKDEQGDAGEKQDIDPANQNADLANQNADLGLPIRYDSLRNDTLQNDTNSSAQALDDSDCPEIPDPIPPDKIIQLWNRKVLSSSDIPDELMYKSISFGGGVHHLNFEKTMSFAEMRNMEKWDEIFQKVLEPSWLRDSGPLSLTWMIKYDNILEVISGKYHKKSSHGDSETGDTDWAFMNQGATSEH